MVENDLVHSLKVFCTENKITNLENLTSIIITQKRKLIGQNEIPGKHQSNNLNWEKGYIL